MLPLPTTIRRMLLLDAVGAVVTATSVGVLLPLVQPLIGLPVPVLRGLGAAAAGFAVFSFWHGRAEAPPAWALRTIAGLNLSYCAVTLGLLLVSRDAVRPLGWAYFLAEITLVVALSRHELHLAKGHTV